MKKRGGLASYILARIFGFVLTLFAVSFLIFFLERLSGVDPVAVAPAERDMAACVFVEQGLVIEDILVAYRGILGNERELAYHAGALVGGNYLFKSLFALFRLAGNSLAVLEGYREVLDKLTAV